MPVLEKPENGGQDKTTMEQYLLKGPISGAFIGEPAVLSDVPSPFLFHVLQQSSLTSPFYTAQPAWEVQRSCALYFLGFDKYKMPHCRITQTRGSAALKD